MHDFTYKRGELFAEKVAVRKIVEAAGTPVYIYSHKTLLRHYRAFADAFSRHPHIVCFALKANSTMAVLKALARQGCGADVVSGGELHLARKAGISPQKIVYAGVGKTEEEIAYALKSRILLFNVESSDELKAIDGVAGRLRMKAPIALRVNPDISASTHPYISTGMKKHKFGIPIENALEYYDLALRLRNVRILGIHQHIGSQITKLAPFVEALKKILALADDLRDHGIDLQYLDAGGGLGIPYRDETPPQPRDLARALMPLLKDHHFTLITEPGRSISGNAGILVTKVLYLKKQHNKEFVIVDAGMNDLLRPSLYSAYHEIQPVKKNRRRKAAMDIVGPICESGDFLARDRSMSRPSQNDLLAVMSAGAYSFSMSSNYNSRPRAAEVYVNGSSFSIVRKRETYGDLTRGTSIPAFLR